MTESRLPTSSDVWSLLRALANFRPPLAHAGKEAVVSVHALGRAAPAASDKQRAKRAGAAWRIDVQMRRALPARSIARALAPAR